MRIVTDRTIIILDIRIITVVKHCIDNMRVKCYEVYMAAQLKPSSLVDALCVAQACRGVMGDVWSSCKQWADHYNVPEDVVFAIVADQFMFERTGIPPLEAEYFAQMANDILTEELIAFYEETKARLGKSGAVPIGFLATTDQPLDLK